MPTSWSQVLLGLEARRSAAFARVDAAMLSQVYAAGSAALEQDRAALAELQRQGVHAEELRMVIEQVSALEVDVGAVTLRVVDRLPPYRLVDGFGATVRTEPGRGSAAWRLTLTPSEEGWQISDIAPD